MICEQMAWWDSENEGASPRISFSFNLSATDRTWSEKPKREDMVSSEYAIEFEFCRVNNCIKTLSYADELFVDGKILPPGRGFESQPQNMTRHLSLDKSRRPSPVRFSSFPPSKAESVAGKRSPKPSGRWTDYYLCVFPFSRRKSNIKDFKSPPWRSQSADYLHGKSNTTVTKAPDFPKAITSAYSSHSYARNGRFREHYSPKPLKTNSLPNISGVNMRVSPVLNVSPALFGLSAFSKKEGRKSLHSASAGYIDR